jgi:hypothetical protein
VKVEIFTFCDFVQDNGGKLTLVGCFDTIHARSFPAVHPVLGIAARLRFSVQERGRHVFRLSFTDLEGEEAFPPIEGEARIEEFHTSTNAINISMNIVNAQLRKETTITARLEMDGKEVSYTPLHLAKSQ